MYKLLILNGNIYNHITTIGKKKCYFEARRFTNNHRLLTKTNNSAYIIFIRNIRNYKTI